jgi:hypothetical protein
MLQTGWRANWVSFILLYMDNAKLHNSNYNFEQMMQLEFKWAIYPSYSPDLTSSDFLFGWLKGELVRWSLIEMEDIFQVVSEILGNLTIYIVRSVFLAWTDRLK